MDEELTFDCLTAEGLACDGTWAGIYNESFPSSEREPLRVIGESVRRGVGMALRARAGGETVAVATTHLLNDPPAVFLVYLATAGGLRGRGRGGALLEYAWRAGAERLAARGARALGMVWEVDATGGSRDAEELRVRARRVAFFGRHGGELLPRPYVQPPVDGIAPVPMSLMFRPAEGRGLPDAELTEALVRAIYLEKYRAVNGIPEESLESLLPAALPPGRPIRRAPS